MSNCTSGCRTNDHESYSACLKSKNATVAYANEASGHDYTASKKWDQRLDNYAKARKEGIQPASTRADDTAKAVRISDKIGEAFQA